MLMTKDLTGYVYLSGEIKSNGVLKKKLSINEHEERISYGAD